MVKRKWRYFGNGFIETDVQFKRFGQEHMLTDADALNILQAITGIIPSEDWPFLPEHEKIRKLRVPANEDYMTRHRQALARSREMLSILGNPAPEATPAEPEEQPDHAQYPGV